jgi:mxaD protein
MCALCCNHYLFYRRISMLRRFPAILTFLFFILTSFTTIAIGNLSVTKSITINSPSASVWTKIKDFNALNSWHPAVAKDEIVEGENNQVGAVRLLTLGDGGTIKDKLLAWDDAGMSLSYSILEGVLPVSNYESTLSVRSLSDTSSEVTWTGSFSAGGGADDQTAFDAISGVYEAGLENLAKMMSSE